MLKKMFSLFIVAGLLGLYSAGCGREEQKTPGKQTDSSSKEEDRYYNKSKGFSIKFPAEWEKQEGNLTEVIALSPLDNSADIFRENVSVVVDELSKEFTLKEYFEASLKGMNEMLTGFQERETGRTTIDNSDAGWLIYSHKMGTINFRAVVYFLVSRKRGYGITCTALPDAFSKYQSEFEKIAKTFKFE